MGDHLAEFCVVRRRYVGVRLRHDDNNAVAAHVERVLYRYGICDAAVEVVLSVYLHRVAEHRHGAGRLDDGQQLLLVGGFGEELRLAGLAAGARVLHVYSALEICIKVEGELLVGVLERHFVEVDYLVNLNKLLESEVGFRFRSVYLPRGAPYLP